MKEELTKRNWLQRIIDIFNLQLVEKSNLMSYSREFVKRKE